MSNHLTSVILAALYAVHATVGLACSPVDTNQSTEIATVSSAMPAKVVPSGAIQLKVAAPDYEHFAAAVYDAGKITLSVKQVLNGKFENNTVRLNTTNADGCNSFFEPQVGDFFITVLPMEYSDGEPITDKDGEQEFGSLFYKDEFPSESKNDKIRAFAEYSLMPRLVDNFYDRESFECLSTGGENFGNWPQEAWRRCVRPSAYLALDCEQTKDGKFICKEDDDLLTSRPAELRRSFSFWVHHRMKISAIFLILILLSGMGYFFLKRKSPHHDR